MGRKRRVVSIVGARPQFIKVKPISEAFLKYKEYIEEIIIHTGQHYDDNMSEIFFKELDIKKPVINLGVGSGTHAEQTAKIMRRLEKQLKYISPHIVIVYGDTNSTLAGALVSAKMNIPIAHVEAGLRSFNMRMPEEINRIVTDRLSSLLFAPTERAVKNLKMEGITQGVYKVGDVMVDCLLMFKNKIKEKKDILNKLRISPKKYCLLTIHRAENTEDKERLKNIIEIMDELGESIDIIFPVHPRTAKYLRKFKIKFKNIIAIEPVSYIPMLVLEKNARIIVTDSGGIQKEAYIFGVPCITLRKETEWIETIKNKGNYLAGADKKSIKVLFFKLMKNKEVSIKYKEVYGKGDASLKITFHIWKFLENRVFKT